VHPHPPSQSNADDVHECRTISSVTHLSVEDILQHFMMMAALKDLTLMASWMLTFTIDPPPSPTKCYGKKGVEWVSFQGSG
jgi:hypothetical protein